MRFTAIGRVDRPRGGGAGLGSQSGRREDAWEAGSGEARVGGRGTNHHHYTAAFCRNIIAFNLYPRCVNYILEALPLDEDLEFMDSAFLGP